MHSESTEKFISGVVNSLTKRNPVSLKDIKKTAQLQIDTASDLLDEQKTPKYYIGNFSKGMLAKYIAELKTLIQNSNSEDSDFRQPIFGIERTLVVAQKEVTQQRALRTEIEQHITHLQSIKESQQLDGQMESDLQELTQAQAKKSLILGEEYLKLQTIISISKKSLEKKDKTAEEKAPPQLAPLLPSAVTVDPELFVNDIIKRLIQNSPISIEELKQTAKLQIDIVAPFLDEEKTPKCYIDSLSRGILATHILDLKDFLQTPTPDLSKLKKSIFDLDRTFTIAKRHVIQQKELRAKLTHTKLLLESLLKQNKTVSDETHRALKSQLFILKDFLEKEDIIFEQNILNLEKICSSLEGLIDKVRPTSKVKASKV